MDYKDHAGFEELFESMGIAELPEEEKNKIAERFMESVDEAVILRLADMLSDEEMMEFTDLEGEAAEKFLADRNIDLSNVAIEESVRLAGDLAVHVDNVHDVIEEQSGSQS